MNSKKCSKCKEEKEIKYFGCDKNRLDGFYPQCKQCRKESWKKNRERSNQQKRLYRKNNLEKVRRQERESHNRNREIRNIQNKIWAQRNRNSILKNKKEYWKKNKEKILEKKRERYANDLIFKISKNLRGRLIHAVKSNYKAGSAVRDLGCSIEELKKHLESQFYPNPKTGEMMAWNNHTFYGWHIDHIKPLSAFDLTDRKQFLEACHYTNLQPLWWFENLSKGNKYE